MRDRRHHRWFGAVLEQQSGARRDQSWRRCASAARSRRRDFGGAGTGYWNWSEPKRCWRRSGRRDARGRGSPRRRAALRPARARAAARGAGRADPVAVERLRYLITRTVRARGLVREARVRDYYRCGAAGPARADDRGAGRRRRARACPAARERRRRAGRGRRLPSCWPPAPTRRPAHSCSRRSTTCCGTASRRTPSSGSTTASRSTSPRSSGSRATTCCRWSMAPRSSGAST